MIFQGSHSIRVRAAGFLILLCLLAKVGSGPVQASENARSKPSIDLELPDEPPLEMEEAASASDSSAGSGSNFTVPGTDLLAGAAGTTGSAAFGKRPVLKGSISGGNNAGAPSPLLSGSLQMVPKGTTVDLTLQCHLNSELSQKGQEVFARISRDVTAEDGSKVVLPGKWVAHGYVTRVDKQKHNGRDGFVEVKFDRIISPDGEWEVPFETSFSTKDNELKSAAKVLFRDTKFATIGALAGSILSVQMTGLPVAISTYGISVGIGGGVGATYGLVCAMARKGKICSVYPGDHVQLKLSEPLSLPGFNPLALDSAKNSSHLPGFSLAVTDFKFEKDPVSQDKRGQVLRLWLTAENRSRRSLNLRNLRVVSEMDDIYAPHLSAAMMRFQELAPGGRQFLVLPFSVDSKKHKYSLVLLKDASGAELARAPIN